MYCYPMENLRSLRSDAKVTEMRLMYEAGFRVLQPGGLTGFASFIFICIAEAERRGLGRRSRAPSAPHDVREAEVRPHHMIFLRELD